MCRAEVNSLTLSLTDSFHAALEMVEIDKHWYFSREQNIFLRGMVFRGPTLIDLPDTSFPGFQTIVCMFPFEAPKGKDSWKA